MEPSRYELEAAKAIEQWKNQPRTWLNKAKAVVSWPVDRGGDLIMRTPGMGWVIEKSVGGLVSLA